ncbi:hypothetical protein [Streptomyces aureocirculatus]|uniref:hypothetical protein n=1 Tax=Streptomyces aureocirculatus TaxID=67275 RepID=UPI0004CAB960|nr:hypothetical protein [Streptomyces aureocirculatus]
MTAPGANFASPQELCGGMVVYDRVYQMPAVVRRVDGLYVELSRPTGMEWRVAFYRLRRATEWEHRQLVAVGRLHRQRQRGLVVGD